MTEITPELHKELDLKVQEASFMMQELYRTLTPMEFKNFKYRMSTYCGSVKSSHARVCQECDTYPVEPPFPPIESLVCEQCRSRSWKRQTLQTTGDES